MIREKIDNLIKQAMLDKDQPRTEVLRAIKNEFLVYQTAKMLSLQMMPLKLLF